jgi:hypothetical protein
MSHPTTLTRCELERAYLELERQLVAGSEYHYGGSDE